MSNESYGNCENVNRNRSYATDVKNASGGTSENDDQLGWCPLCRWGRESAVTHRRRGERQSALFEQLVGSTPKRRLH